MTEDQARAVLLLQGIEDAGQGTAADAIWTTDDGRWATRAAAQGLPAGAPRELQITERARLAMQRLAPRDATLRRWLSRRVWHPAWPWLAAAVGGLLGLASDALVSGPYFNLLSPLFWGLLAWNGGFYVLAALSGLLQPARSSGLAARLARWLALRGVGHGQRWWPGAAARWAEASAPLSLARAAALLHGLAAGLALGLVAGLVARGLVLDYRAGWATTLLEPQTVHAVLMPLFHPAWALTGQVPPDAFAFEALRVVVGQPATASAAPWIVLMSVQLLLWVVLPRVVLSALALWRARRLSADFPLAVDDPAFDRWLPVTATAVWVLPHGQAPGPAAVLGLRSLLAGAWGDGVQVTVADPLPWGDEDSPPAVPAGAIAVLLVDLATTPEPEVHGRLLQALAPARLVVVADAAGFVRRFGSGDRLAQRQAAWRVLLGTVPFVGVDLSGEGRAAGDAGLTAAARSLREQGRR